MSPTRQNKKLQAIFDEDLVAVLRKIGQLEKVESGQVVCSVCGCLITLKNMQIIISQQKNEFNFICNNTLCVEKFYNNQGRAI